MPSSHGYTRSSASLATGRRTEWAVGDIAFLKPAASFSLQDHSDLIKSGYLHEGATTHPVLLLAVKNQKAIACTISAYSTEHNNYEVPWKQWCHRHKNRDHFRAFEGSQRPDQRHDFLRLADPSTMRMPKPRASWVYIKHFFCVPFSVLGHFNKAPVLLRASPASVAQLKQDMRQFTKQYNETSARFNSGVSQPDAIVDAPPHRAAPVRQTPPPPPPARPAAQAPTSAQPATPRALAKRAAKSWASVAQQQQQPLQFR